MINLPRYLAMAGTLPVSFCTLALLLSVDSIPILGATRDVLSVYCLLIAVFMAGSLWGHQANNQSDTKSVYLLLSNLIVLALCFVFLLDIYPLTLISLFNSFAALLIADRYLLAQGFISQEYFKLRYQATFIVLANLLITGIFT